MCIESSGVCQRDLWRMLKETCDVCQKRPRVRQKRLGVCGEREPWCVKREM